MAAVPGSLVQSQALGCGLPLSDASSPDLLPSSFPAVTGPSRPSHPSSSTGERSVHGLVVSGLPPSRKAVQSPSALSYPTTDASNLGWGASLPPHHLSGLWSPQDSKLHINMLELKEVSLALQGFVDQVSVLVKSDNSTVVSYTNHQEVPTQFLCVWLPFTFFPGVVRGRFFCPLLTFWENRI